MAIDLSLTEEQLLLKQNLRAFFERECTPDVIREARQAPGQLAASLFQQLKGIGVYGLAVPPEHGGEGGGFVDLAVACREFGRALAPVPYASVAAVAAPVLARYGSPPLRASQLPAVAAGTVVVPALAEADGRFLPGKLTTEVTATMDGLRLRGRKLFVVDGQVAEAFLVSAVDQSGFGRARSLLAFVPAGADGVGRNPLYGAAADRQAELVLSDVRVGEAELLPPEAELLAHASGQVATAHDLFGAAQAAFELAVEYAKERVQFGRPIGSFQAIQFKLADAMTALDGADYLTFRASWLLDQGSLEAVTGAAMAKQFATEAAVLAVRHAHQIFAGVGFIREHHLHLYTLRVQAGELLYGGPKAHARSLGRALLAGSR